MFINVSYKHFMCFSFFRDQPGDKSNKYSYNPCYPFTEGKCTNVAVSESNIV